MTRTQAIGHVLRRLWFWPLIFWIRPLDVAGRLRERPGLELITAILGSGVWGTLAGVALWLRTDDLQAIWVLSLAVAVVGAVPGAGAVAGAVAVASTVAVTVAGAVAVTGAVAGAAAGMLGIALGVWLPASVLIYLLVPIAAVIVFSSFKLAWDERTGHETAGWILYTWTIAFLVLLPIMAFALFPHSALSQIPQWSIALCIALGVGAIVEFFFDNTDGLEARRAKGDLRIGAEAQTTWLIVSWVPFLILAGAAYGLGPQASGLDAKLDHLALFLGLAPLFLTGLPAWPLMAATAFWQYRSRVGQASAPERLARTIAFRWQSFAYPLPGLGSYLTRLGRNAGPAAALGAIQSVQFDTLQYAAARRAVRKLASDPATALPFCGTVAMETNIATLTTLARVGTAGLAVAALAAKGSKEDEEPLLLNLGKIRRGRSWHRLFRETGQGQAEDSEPDLEQIRGRATCGTDRLCRAATGEAGRGRVGPRISGPPGCVGGARRSVGTQTAQPAVPPVGSCFR